LGAFENGGGGEEGESVSARERGAAHGAIMTEEI
jgi:hypothetical protein